MTWYFRLFQQGHFLGVLRAIHFQFVKVSPAGNHFSPRIFTIPFDRVETRLQSVVYQGNMIESRNRADFLKRDLTISE